MRPVHRLRVAAVAAMVILSDLALEAESPAAPPPAAAKPDTAPSQITGALLAGLPRYAPAPAKAFEAAPARDEGGAAGEILHLPKITIRPDPVVPESDFALLNPKGRLELALKTNPGIRLGNFFGLNEIIARTMQQDERLAAKKANLVDQVQRSTLGDSEVDRKIRELTQALLQRSGTERDYPPVYLPPRESGERPKR